MKKNLKERATGMRNFLLRKRRVIVLLSHEIFFRQFWMLFLLIFSSKKNCFETKLYIEKFIRKNPMFFMLKIVFILDLEGELTWSRLQIIVLLLPTIWIWRIKNRQLLRRLFIYTWKRNSLKGFFLISFNAIFFLFNCYYLRKFISIY